MKRPAQLMNTPTLLAKINAGSQLYRTSTETSDVDSMEVYVADISDVICQRNILNSLVSGRRWGDHLSQIKEEAVENTHAGKVDSRAIEAMDLVGRALSGDIACIKSLYSQPDDFLEGDHDLWLRVINLIPKEAVLTSRAVTSTLLGYSKLRDYAAQYVYTPEGNITGIQFNDSKYEERMTGAKSGVNNIAMAAVNLAVLFAIDMYGKVVYDEGAMDTLIKAAYSFKRNPSMKAFEHLVSTFAPIEWVMSSKLKRSGWPEEMDEIRLNVMKDVSFLLYSR